MYPKRFNFVKVFFSIADRQYLLSYYLLASNQRAPEKMLNVIRFFGTTKEWELNNLRVWDIVYPRKWQ
jgi:hypothetical protein